MSEHEVLIQRKPNDLRPTVVRRFHDGRGHRPPMSGVDHTGRPWRGTSRVIDRAARRRSNRRSWLHLKAESRRAYVAAKAQP